jgi:hypothetical protein
MRVVHLEIVRTGITTDATARAPGQGLIRTSGASSNRSSTGS